MQQSKTKLLHWTIFLNFILFATSASTIGRKCDRHTEFACKSLQKLCIPLSQVNDGVKDCPDGSDEGQSISENENFVRDVQAVVPIILRGKTVRRTITKTVEQESTVTQTRTLPANNGPTQLPFQQQFQPQIQHGLQQPLYAPPFQGIYQQRYPQQFVNQYFPGLQAQPQPQHLVNRYLPYLPNGNPILSQPGVNAPQKHALHPKVARSAQTKELFYSEESSNEPSFSQLLSSGLEQVQGQDSGTSSQSTQTLESAQSSNNAYPNDDITTIFTDENTEVYEQSASEIVKSVKVDDSRNMNAVNDKYGLGLKFQKRKLQQFRTIDDDFLSFQLDDITRVPGEAPSTPHIEVTSAVQPQTPLFTNSPVRQFTRVRQPVRNTFDRPAGPRRRFRPQRRPQRPFQPINGQILPPFRNIPDQRFPTDFSQFPNTVNNFQGPNRPQINGFRQTNSFRRQPVQGPRRVPIVGPRRVPFNGPRRIPDNTNVNIPSNNFRQIQGRRPQNLPEIQPSSQQPVRPTSVNIATNPTDSDDTFLQETPLSFESKRNSANELEPEKVSTAVPSVPRPQPSQANDENNIIPPGRRVRVQPRRPDSGRRRQVISRRRPRPTRPTEPTTPVPPPVSSADIINTPEFGIRNEIEGPRRVTIRRTRPVNNQIGATNQPQFRRRVVTRRPQRVKTELPSAENSDNNDIVPEKAKDKTEIPELSEKAKDSSSSSVVNEIKPSRTPTGPRRRVTIRKTRPGNVEFTRSGVRRVVVTKSRTKSQSTPVPEIPTQNVNGLDNELPTEESVKKSGATPIKELFDKPIPVTYYTTYTYFTTFVQGDNTLYTSREAFFNNVRTQTLEPSIVNAIQSSNGYTLDPSSNTVVPLGSRTRENIVTIVNLGSRIQVANTDVKNAVLPTKVNEQTQSKVPAVQPNLNILQNPDSDLNTVRLSDLVSVPKTYFTQFTYYYTFYDGLSTRLSERAETYSNVVTNNENYLTASFTDKINSEGILTVGPTAELVNLASRNIDGTTTEVNLGLLTLLKFDGVSNVAIRTDSPADSILPSQTTNIQPTSTYSTNQQFVSTERPRISTPILEGSFSQSEQPDNSVVLETPTFERPSVTVGETPLPSRPFGATPSVSDVDSEFVSPNVLNPSEDGINENSVPAETEAFRKPFLTSRIYRPFNSDRLDVISVEPSQIVKDGTTRRRVKVTVRRPSSLKGGPSKYTRFVKPSRFHITSKPRFAVVTRPRFDNRFSKPTRKRKTLKVTRRPTPVTPTPTVMYETYTTLATVPVVFGLETIFREALLTLTKTEAIKPPTIAPTRAITLTYYTTTTYTIPVVQDGTTVFSQSQDINSRVVTRTIIGSATSSQAPTSRVSPTPVIDSSPAPSLTTVTETINGEVFTFTYFPTQTTDSQYISSTDVNYGIEGATTTIVSSVPSGVEISSILYPAPNGEVIGTKIIKTEPDQAVVSTIIGLVPAGNIQEKIQAIGPYPLDNRYNLATRNDNGKSVLVANDGRVYLTPGITTESTVLTDPQPSQTVAPISFSTSTVYSTFTLFTTLFSDGTPIISSNEQVSSDVITFPVSDQLQVTSTRTDEQIQTESLIYETSEKTLIKTEYNTLTFFATLFNGTEQIVTPIKETQSSLVTATETYTITRTASPELPQSAAPSVNVISPSAVSYITRTELNTVTNVVTFFQGEETIVTSLQDIITNIVTEPVQGVVATPPFDISAQTTVVPVVDTKTIFDTQTHFVTLFSGTETITSSITEVNSNLITETIDYITKTIQPEKSISASADEVSSPVIKPFTYTPPAITATATIDGKVVTTVIPALVEESSPQVLLSSPVVRPSIETEQPIIDTVVSTYTYFTTRVEGDQTIVSSHEEPATQYITRTAPQSTPVILSTPVVPSVSESVTEIYSTRTQLSTNTFTFTLFNGTVSNVITSEQVGTQIVTDTITSTIQVPVSAAPSFISPKASEISPSVLTISTTYTYYTTVQEGTRNVLQSKEEVITKFITLDAPYPISTVETTQSPATPILFTSPVPSIHETSSEPSQVPHTTVIGGNTVVFFTDVSSETLASPVAPSPSVSGGATSTTVIDDSTVVFYNTQPSEAAPVSSSTQIIDGSTIVFFPTAQKESDLKSSPSESVIDTSSVTPTPSTTVAEKTSATPVLKPFTSVINGATVIFFKEVFEEISTSSSDLPSSTFGTPDSTATSDKPDGSVDIAASSVEATPGTSPNVEILTGSSIIFFTPSNESDTLLDTTTETLHTTTDLESSVDSTTSENVNSGSETPQLEISSTTPLTVPNIVTSVLESATTFVGSNGETTSAAASATLIFITGTDGNVLTLMPATLAANEVTPTKTLDGELEESTTSVTTDVPAVSVVTDETITTPLSADNSTDIEELDTLEPAIKDIVDMIKDNTTDPTLLDTTETVGTTEETVSTTEDAVGTTEEAVSTVEEAVSTTEEAAVTTEGTKSTTGDAARTTEEAANVNGGDTLPELIIPDVSVSKPESSASNTIRPIFLQPDLFPINTANEQTTESTQPISYSSSSSFDLPIDTITSPDITSSTDVPKQSTSESTVKTDIITGATTFFIDPAPTEAVLKTESTSDVSDSASSISTELKDTADVSIITGEETKFIDEAPSNEASESKNDIKPTETIVSGATTVFGGVLFTRPSPSFTSKPNEVRPEYTGPVFVPLDNNEKSVIQSSISGIETTFFPELAPSEEQTPSVVKTQYITRTESVTRTLTLSTTSIYYTKGSPLTVTQFYTTTIAPRTIVSTIIGDQTILGTASRAQTTDAIQPDTASGYDATPITTTVTTTTLIFNSITTTVVRTLVIPTIAPSQIDLSEATEAIYQQQYPDRPTGRSEEYARRDKPEAENRHAYGQNLNEHQGVRRQPETPRSEQADENSRPTTPRSVPPQFETNFPGEDPNFNEIEENRSMCVPECDYNNHEMCKKLEDIWRCECRPGFARTDKLRHCEATQTYTVLLRVVKMKQSAIKYRTDYSNSQSNEYQDFSNMIKNGIDKAYGISQVSDNYLGADVMNVVDGKTDNNPDGVLVNFTVKVSKDAPVSENLLKEELYKSLQSTNYSVGGTDLYVQPYVQSIENVTDFDECSHSDFNDCADNAYCFNVKGTYLCQCREDTEDLSDPQFPGRVCGESSVACKYCNSHGECYKKPDGREGCRCYYWYLGERCEVNGRVLVIVLPIILIVVLTAALCAICCCLKRRSKKEKKMAANSMFAPYPGYAGTLDRKAMIPETSSSSSIGKGSQFTPVSSAFRKIIGKKSNGSKNCEFTNSMDKNLAYGVPSIAIPRAKYHSAKSSEPDFSETHQNKLMNILDEDKAQNKKKNPSGMSSNQMLPHNKYSNFRNKDFEQKSSSSSWKNNDEFMSGEKSDGSRSTESSQIWSVEQANKSSHRSKNTQRSYSEGPRSCAETTIHPNTRKYYDDDQFSQFTPTEQFGSEASKRMSDMSYSTFNFPKVHLSNHQSKSVYNADGKRDKNLKLSANDESAYKNFYNERVDLGDEYLHESNS